MPNNNKKYDFTGKVALITGSSSGIGAATALLFVQYGAKVTIHGRNVQALNKMAQKIKQKSQIEPVKVIGDLLDPILPAKLINETIARYGRLDFLVNNAGGGSANDSLDDDKLMESYEKLFGLNVRCVMQLTQLAMPYLVKTKGAVVNISSVASMRPYFPVYSSAKAALDMFTKASAQHLGPKGVRVNAINPGPVLTGFGRSVGLSIDDFEKAVIENLKSTTLLNRVPIPEEIGNLVLFLSSPDAANITGSIIVTDTGVLVKPEVPNLQTD